MAPKSCFGFSVLFAFSLPISISAQSIPGASFFSGNGIPGAGPYQLVDDYQPAIFFNKFNFYSSYDPTYGHVQYVNQSVAVKNGYASTSSSTAKISVDTTNKWPRGGPGRPSVRVISDNTYTHGLFILDAIHMPWGCGTWPAYWLLGPNWPYTGEIDIIEGVNTQSQNSISLHTSPGCTVAGTGQTGTLQTTNCDSNANGNSGCGSTLSNTTLPNNYGSGYNTNGGGVYVTEWTSSYFKTWFFPRGSIPDSITSGKPNVSTFGTPAVNHQGSCNIDQHFTNMSIIINIDFCGAWAGQVYSQYGDCPQNKSANSLDSCVDFVGNNPSSFTNAYWEINSIKVYQMPAGAQPSSSYTTSLSSAVPSATTNTINQGMGQTSTSLSSAPYTGPVSSVTASTSAAATPIICPAYNASVWTDYNGQGYTIGCGQDYNGAGDSLPGSGVSPATSFENCMEICDTTSGCVAVAFVGGNGAGTCYAKSSKGAIIFNGAANAAVRLNPPVSLVSSSVKATTSSSASVTAGPSSPTCPGAAGSTFVDSQGVSYGIICYTDYTGNNIGTPISITSLSTCLPACDSMSGCAGVVFNPFYNLCQLKSSFTGTQTGNNSVIAARRNAVAATPPPSSKSAQATSLGYGYGGNSVSDDYGYGSPASGSGVTRTSTSSWISSSSSVIRTTTSSSVTSPSLTLTFAPSTSSTSSGSQSSSTSYVLTTSSAQSSSTWSTTLVAISTTSSPPTVSSQWGSSSSSTAATSTMSELEPIESDSSLVSSDLLDLSSSILASSSSVVSSTPSLTSTTWMITSTSGQYSTSTAQVSTSSVLSSSQSKPTLQSGNSLVSSSSTTSLQIISSTIVTTTWSPSQVPGASTVQSITSASPCPTNAAGFCDQPGQQQTTCADNLGAIYFVSCGIVYTGEIIDTSGIYGRDYQLLARATEPDVASCQRLCDRYSACVAFNYIGTNCVLLSRVTSGISNANAIGGSLIRAAPAAASTSTVPPVNSTSLVSQNSTTSTNVSGSSSTSFSTVSQISSTSFAQVTVTTSPAVTIVTTVTTSVPPGGYYTTGPNGSYYVYPSTQSPGSASLCFTCSLTPTVVTTPSIPSTTTCSTTSWGTITVFTTSTVTSCGPQPTCPASGYFIIGPSQSYPGQQVVTTTGLSGGNITYTQIPSSSSGLSPSSSSPPNTAQPTCPGADRTIYTDSMGVQYRIYCDTIFTDITLDTQTQSTLSGCIASCDMYNTRTFYLGTQCFGVSWYENQTTNNCLLKGGSTPMYQRGCDSCAILYPQYPPSNNSSPGGYGTITYTTVVGGTTAVSTYTTTVPASTVTIYSTIYTNGQTLPTVIGYSTIPATTIIRTTTVVQPGSTIVTQRQGGPGSYGGGGPGNGGGVSTVYAVSTVASTYVSNGQTIISTYGVTTVQSIVYLPGTTQTQTITTTSVSISLVPTTIVTTLSQGYTTTIVTYVPAQGGSNGPVVGGPAPTQTLTQAGPTQTQTITTTSVSILLSVTVVPTTIVTTLSQGYTTTIVSYVTRTYTQGGGNGGSGSGGGGGGTVTVTEGGGGPTTVYITLTVTKTVLPSSSSSSFTCRSYATNYLNGLHGRAEPTSAPLMRNGIVLQPVVPAVAATDRKRSIFEREVIMAQAALVGNVDTGFGLWFVE